MPGNRSSRIANVIAVGIAAWLVYLIVEGAGGLWPTPAQGPTPKPFTMKINGGFVELDQAGYRHIRFRPSALTSFARYEAGHGIADQFDHPVLLLRIAGHEYRLDCADEAQVDLFADFMIATSKKETEILKSELK